MPCSALFPFVEVAILVEMSEPPARRTVGRTVVTSSNFTNNLLRLAVKGSSALDITHKIYSYEAVGTDIFRNTHTMK